MVRYIFIFFVYFFSFSSYSNDNLLTIQQQLDRLQREVSDLSQTVFSNEQNSNLNNSNNNLAGNLSAIDMRIYDLEKDVKSLTGSIEDIFFQIEDIIINLNNFEDTILSLENTLLDIKTNKLNTDSSTTNYENSNVTNLKQEPVPENTLGSLKITNENVPETENSTDQSTINDENDVQLSPEDQFQLAFDDIRNKNWENARNSLLKFIENYPENQLSGSAHYWLGELYILEKKFRDAALVFAEGFQKFPESIKAPDMLFKLSQTLYEVDKIKESCKTIEKLILDYPKNKLIKSAKKQLQDFGCLEVEE